MSTVLEAYPLYYEITQQAQAQAEAQQRHLPVAWLGSLPANSDLGESKAQAAQLALTTLQNHAVVIFFEREKIESVPSLVQTEFKKPDDGPDPLGQNWASPKVVFTDPGVTKAIGRVSYTQMSHEGTVAALNTVLQIIRNTPDMLEPAPSPPPVVAHTEINRPVPPAKPRNHTINYIVIIIGIPLAWYIYSRGRDRDAGKK